MKPANSPPVHSARLLDYLPDHPRFDGLRRVFAANELSRAEQLYLPELRVTKLKVTDVSKLFDANNTVNKCERGI